VQSEGGNTGGTGFQAYLGPIGPMGPVQNSAFKPPTVNPQVPGAMWNNGGTIVFSPGIPGGSSG
jgi:hypothetical protein